jgi:hypothetical protein
MCPTAGEPDDTPARLPVVLDVREIISLILGEDIEHLGSGTSAQ